MPRDEFDNAGEFFKIGDYLGKLVLFTPTSYIESMVTSFGDSDAIQTDVVVLDEDGQPDFSEALVFQGALIATLKRRLKIERTIERDAQSGVVTTWETTTPKRVLGVVALGEKKKANQSAPYILNPASDEQKDLARKWIADNPIPAPTRKIVDQRVEVGVQAVQVASPVPAQVTTSAQPVHPAGVPQTSYADAGDDPFAGQPIDGDPFATEAP